jgi:hypothetical protein
VDPIRLATCLDRSAAASGASASMVSPCLPWRKLPSLTERLAIVERPPASGGSSGRSEPSSGLEPLRRRWQVWASGEAVNEGSEDRGEAWASDKAELEDDRGRLIEAAGKTQSPVMAALAGQHAYGCLGNDRSPRHSRHWHRRREIVFTARSRH